VPRSAGALPTGSSDRVVLRYTVAVNSACTSRVDVVHLPGQYLDLALEHGVQGQGQGWQHEHRRNQSQTRVLRHHYEK
jgi:hypothetical protein